MGTEGLGSQMQQVRSLGLWSRMQLFPFLGLGSQTWAYSPNKRSRERI